jgi:Periplasmic protein TonB, links inner and outer membranes
MKIILSSMVALAIAGSPLPTQEPDPKEKPKQEEPKKQPEPKAKPQPDEKPKPKQEPAPPPKQPKPDEKQQQPDEKERQKQQKEEAKREKSRPPQEPSTKPENRQQSSAQGKGRRIPPEKFRASFGREHHFRVARRDDRRFQYSGYWFEVVEVWPAGWSYQDDCYIEEDGDDYYLVDIVHPEIRVLVIVVSA